MTKQDILSGKPMVVKISTGLTVVTVLRTTDGNGPNAQQRYWVTNLRTGNTTLIGARAFKRFATDKDMEWVRRNAR